MTNFAAAARICLPGVLFAAGACAPDVYVMRAETVIDGTEQRDHGIGCQMLGAGSNESGVGPGAPMPHFGQRHEHSDDGMREDTHALVETTDAQYLLRHTPKDTSAVEFASYRTWIDRGTFLPMKIEYTNAAGDVYRRVEVTRVEEIAGYPTVTLSRVSDLAGGGQTDMQFRYIDYDLGLEDAVFTERSLRSPPRQWLERPEG
jgi:hypothetical protein